MAPPSRIEQDQMLVHDFPLRPNLMVRLVLPAHLTRTEAERIATFVESLAFAVPADATAGGQA